MLRYLCLVLVFTGVLGEFPKNYEDLNTRSFFANRLEDILSNANLQISPQCKTNLRRYGAGLVSKDFWAIKMFDAGAKLPSGLLEIPSGDLGAFDQCLSIQAKTDDIHGQYCLGAIPLPADAASDKRNSLLLNNPETRAMTPSGEVGIQLATCLPSGCSPSELQEVYKAIGIPMVFHKDLCQTKASGPKLDAGAIATISFLGVILWAMLASTAYDIILHYLSKKPYYQILIAFSVLTNTKKLMKTSSGPNQISCLHGIRVISTMWVILGHRYSIQNMFPMKNYKDTFEWMNDSANMFIMGATVSVDTFFLLAGLVIAYAYMCAVTKGVKFNIIMYYVHRYIRLTPVLAVVILVHVTLLKYFGSGPVWPHTVQRGLITACETNWWKALLYIQNYGEMNYCVPQSWYLSVDTQLFLLSPLLLLPLKRWPVFTLAGTAFLMVCSMITCFLTGWFFELHQGLIGNLDLSKLMDFFKYYYAATQTRAAPWLFGIIVGYVIFSLKQRGRKFQVNNLLMMSLWACSIAVLCTCVFAGHEDLTADYNRVVSSIHLAFVRPAWAVALSFVIFACVTEYGGPVNWFLSLPIFQVVSKLTYTMYLSHYTVIYFLTAPARDAIRFSNPYMMYIFWGDFALTLAVSYVLTLAFESPIITLEKVLFGGATKTAKPEPPAERYVTKQMETA